MLEWDTMLVHDSYESQYHFYSSRKLGFLLFLITVVSMPLTTHYLEQRISTQEYSATNCIVRPSCLDTEPRCTIPEPQNGWCPSKSPGISAPPLIKNTTSSTPVPVSPTSVPAMCSTCLSTHQNYLCTSQKTGKQFCFAITLNAEGFSCVSCSGGK